MQFDPAGCVGAGEPLATLVRTRGLRDDAKRLGHAALCGEQSIKRGTQERGQVPAVEVTVGGFAHGVVAAGKGDDFVIEAAALEFGDYVARKFGQES